MVMKRQCSKCKNLAMWGYGPGGFYYCEDCVPSRGCDCMDGDKDPQGRLLPCVDYDYYEKGIVIDQQ